MAGEEAKKAVPAAAPEAVAEKDVPVVIPPPPGAKPPADDSKALVVVDSIAEKPQAEKKNTHRGSHERDVALAKVETEKMSSLIKAWVENEKAKADNKAAKKLSSILSWENTKKATIDAQLKRKEEELEKKKAEYAEKMKNKKAIAHREAEEKRAMVVARRGEQVLKAEEMAAKYRATGLAPKKLLGCFGA
ncbi:remorin-like isoform X2 [Hordeum vulgare subsp. vulgare]|uniref:remorin-like isoform X2 n=1 Tax=Hordeum vulgare subsp. vulgare TaxID=112509 RepID=UPI0002959789|nr:remorin-like isoform X2 [Hordeum vulgare subsp. vulgare]